MSAVSCAAGQRLVVLDCGSGIFPYRGRAGEKVLTLDCRPETRPTVLHDLTEFPYPFEDSSFDLVNASHILEHLPDVVGFMNEVYRILRPGGRLTVRVPHYSGRSAWCDPTHLRAFATCWARYFCAGAHDRYGDCEFRVISETLTWTRERFHKGFLVDFVLNPVLSRLASLYPKLCERTWCYWVGGFSEVVTVLETVKS